MRTTFSRFVLRTTNPEAATAFYDAVIGRHGDMVFPLHEQAIARGAKPHWLGHLDVADPNSVAQALIGRGAERLGPGPAGAVVLRDPGGALLALGGVTGPTTAGVAWHVLRSQDAKLAASTYSELFGWPVLGEVDLGPVGRYRQFAWSAGEPASGSIGGVEGVSGVHPQWLHLFLVTAVERAVMEVVSHGGVVATTNTLPNGRRFAVCDDPQGAAFGLIDG